MKKWVIGNWKCNVLASDAHKLVDEIKTIESENCSIGIAPPALYVGGLANTTDHIKLGLQDVSEKGNGAFTGEISVELAKSLSCDFSLVGHSERRELFNENDELIRQKTEACLKGGVMPVLCVGESLETRESKQHLPWIYAQIRSVFENLPISSASDIIVAYEPVWAIGTGKIPTLAEIEEVHAYIQQLLAELHPSFGADIAILYGGSVKPDNAKQIFSVKAVSGALVGGASLDSNSFKSIIDAI